MKGLTIAVVGPCASGKTTLVEALKARGVEGAYTVPQEHSVSPRLWSMKHPDVLVYLNASYETVVRRRAVTWGPERLDKQRHRLAHARRHADVYLVTDEMDRQDMVRLVLDSLERKSET